jgi:hypothetical protein
MKNTEIEFNNNNIYPIITKTEPHMTIPASEVGLTGEMPVTHDKSLLLQYIMRNGYQDLLTVVELEDHDTKPRKERAA